MNERPWWRVACGEPCRRWTCVRSALCEPLGTSAVGFSVDNIIEGRRGENIYRAFELRSQERRWEVAVTNERGERRLVGWLVGYEREIGGFEVAIRARMHSPRMGRGRLISIPMLQAREWLYIQLLISSPSARRRRFPGRLIRTLASHLHPYDHDSHTPTELNQNGCTFASATRRCIPFSIAACLQIYSEGRGNRMVSQIVVQLSVDLIPTVCLLTVGIKPHPNRASVGERASRANLHVVVSRRQLLPAVSIFAA